MYGDDPDLEASDFDSEDDSIDPGHVQGVDYETPPKEVSLLSAICPVMYIYIFFSFPILPRDQLIDATTLLCEESRKTLSETRRTIDDTRRGVAPG